MPNAPLKGEVWRLTGVFSRHPRYGVQLRVREARLIRPSGKLLVRFLCNHPSFRGIGIGPAKVSRLYEKLGGRLREVLDAQNTEALTCTLTQEAAEKLVVVWKDYGKELDVVAFLERHKVDTRLSNKILHYWPEGTVEKLQENPYRLLVTANWSLVDGLARSIGIGSRDKRRLIAAAEAAVYDRLDVAKDTLVSERSLRESLRGLLRCYEDETIREAVECAVSDRAIVGDPASGYQAFGCAVMERFLKDRFTAMTGRGVSQPSLFASPDRIASYIQDFESENAINLNAEQMAAVEMGVKERLSVLTGGAGVGKTTVLKAIYHAVEAVGGSIVQMALAGRAAQRMREATGREAYTIIGFLNAVRSGKIKLTGGHLIVIDEASMLDLMLAYRLVRVLPDGARLLLVGDPHQLPPIGPGLIFHSLAQSTAIPVLELTRVHRQAESSGIPAVARQIRRGEVPDIPRFNGPRPGVSFLECNVTSVINNLVDIMSALGGFKETQILGITKSGPAGTDTINQVFHQKLAGNMPNIPEWGLAESDPVIYTVNDYDRDLYNGSLGRVEKVFAEKESDDDEQCRLICDFDGRKVSLTDSDLGNLDLAYAITTHKAQGSQFGRVVIPVTRSRLLDRTLIYTALTRGVEQVVFIGDRGAFNQATSDPTPASIRKVGFAM